MRLKLRWLLAAGLVAGIGAALGFRRSMARIAALLASSSRTVDTKFGTVEYAIMGEGAPVLVLHGAGGGCDQGLHQTALLANKGYRLIAPTRFGYRRSDVPENATPAMQADAYAALLDQLRIRQAVVLSLSAGAWSALQFAVRYPERCRALVLMVPATILPRGTKMYGGFAARVLFRNDFFGWLVIRLAAAFPRLGAALLGTPTALLQRLSRDEKKRVQQVLYDSLPVGAHVTGMKLDLASAHAHDGFPMDKVACPVLAISAADDAFRTAERAKEITKAVPNGTLVVFPSGGHLLVNRQDEAMREVITFLARLPAK